MDRDYRLIEVGRSGRRGKYTSLTEDGSGDAYTSPDGRSRANKYLTLPFEYWYGISGDTVDRGLRELREARLLSRTTTLKNTPLEDSIQTREFRYTLAAPFGRFTATPKPVGRSLAVSDGA